MHLKITNPLVAVCTAAAMTLLCAASAGATSLIPNHNGTLGTDPNYPSDPAGTGIANVQLTCTLGTGAAPPETCDKNFFSNDRHELSWQGPGLLEETVINSTGIPWTDYHFEWTGFDTVTVGIGNVSCAAGIGGACAFEPMLMGDDSDGSLWIFFKSPLTPGTDPDSFGWSFILEGNGTFAQYPTFGVPEPGTLALFGLGLAGLGIARRRKAA